MFLLHSSFPLYLQILSKTLTPTKMSNLPSAYSNSPKHTPTLMRALQALQTTTFPPHHQVLCIPLYLSPYSLYLPKASSLKRLLPSTRATKKKNTSAKG